MVGKSIADETSEFWKLSARSSRTGEMKQIQTTVYRLPCAGFAEKDGSLHQFRALAAMEKCCVPLPALADWIKASSRRFS